MPLEEMSIDQIFLKCMSLSLMSLLEMPSDEMSINHMPLK
jgi:hypothetical protein